MQLVLRENVQQVAHLFPAWVQNQVKNKTRNSMCENQNISFKKTIKAVFENVAYIYRQIGFLDHLLCLSLDLYCLCKDTSLCKFPGAELP